MSLTDAVYAILTAFAVNVGLGPLLISLLKRLNFGQNVRDDGPAAHAIKAGTPIMGGVIILLSFVVSSLFFIKGNMDGLMLLFVTVGFGFIGFLDDYISVTKKRSLGLRAYQKLIAQAILCCAFVYYLLTNTSALFGVSQTSVLVPFTYGYFIDLGVMYVPFVIFVILSVVNAVNLTDGLDGLASGVTLLVVMFFLVIAWVVESMTLPLAGAVVGSLLGFLLFNSHPARVFMGDTGSLALGGFVAALAIMLKLPLFLPIVGVVYLMEDLSDIIQVTYFKLTGGKRFFKMAPIHHTFELSGWEETKIVALFYIITAVAGLVGYLGAEFLF
ncbi:MAG: phospho-N-acetylmuramoyl-pentapeptide-transferase [Clostridiales bacterium]|jgi:phospho-N-acetylmuramoyl-pentapeptide-transferase|nr:phospho-N-acetylmuramoyl-pentapeptide-transferase [Clostridiales bacterium]